MRLVGSSPFLSSRMSISRTSLYESFRTLLVQADQVHRIGVQDHLFQFGHRDAKLLGQLLLGRLMSQPRFERLDRFVELARLRAHQPRHPVHRAQLVEHGTANTRNAVGFELHSPRQIEGVDGVHQSENTGRDQVVEFNALGQARPDPLAVILDQGQVDFDQSVAHFLIRGVLFEFDPQLFHVLRGDSRCHAFLRERPVEAQVPELNLIGYSSVFTGRRSAAIGSSLPGALRRARPASCWPLPSGSSHGGRAFGGPRRRLPACVLVVGTGSLPTRLLFGQSGRHLVANRPLDGSLGYPADDQAEGRERPEVAPSCPQDSGRRTAANGAACQRRQEGEATENACV